MEKWLKDYRCAKKKTEQDALKPIEDKKIEIYVKEQITRLEEQISVLTEKIKILNLDLDAWKSNLITKQQIAEK